MDLWQDFGQKVDLTASIRQILLSYPEGTAVLKELIQNADDAGASTVKFCLDFRRHGTGSLAYEKLAQFQGPSLLVFNDGVFSEADFASISRVGDSVKREQTGKTGRFGIGFNSCYHLCDLPSFVSGRHLALFDPHCDYLPAVSATNPGKKIDFVANPVLEAYPDQFAPFCAFGCDMRQPFPATLFRFPLRTSELAAHSRISKQAYDTHKVQALLASLQHEAMDIMLFLKTVQRLEIHEWRPGQAEPTRLYSCHLANTMPQLQLERSMFVRAAQASKAAVAARAAAASMLSMHSPAPAPSSIPSEPPDASPATSIADGIHASSKQELPAAESSAALTDFTKPLVMFSIHEATFEGRVDGSGAAAQRTFLIAQALGGGAAAEMAAQASAQFRVALTPWGAVAAPLDLDTDTGQTRAFTGSAFCFLPLPVQTGLPVHVNSFFELSSNRRDIWYGSDMAGAGQLRSDWNVCLLNEVVAPTYAKLLTAAAQKLGPCPAFFRLWPADVGGLREPWRGAARRVLEEVAALPVVFTAADGGQWLRPAKAVYTEAATVRQLELEAALLALNLPLAQLPTAVAAALLRYTIPQPQLLSPGLARDWIRSCAPQVCNLHQRHPQQITPLLQYCLADLGVSHGSSDTREAGRGTAADGLVAELSGLPLLPLCDGSLGSFAVGPAEAAAAEAAVLFVPTALERLLLQGAWHLLVDVAAFPEALIDSLQALARHAATNLRLVTATELADRLLPLLLPPRWRGQAEVTWQPAVAGAAAAGASSGGGTPQLKMDRQPAGDVPAGGRSGGGAQQPPSNAWMQLLWQALQGFSRLDAFASWPIVPVHGGLLTALRPLSDSVAVWVGDTWPASLAAVLHKLGCRLVDNAPDLRHPALSQHVHSADGLGILAALRNSLAGVPQERWPGLLAEGEVQAPERRQLRRFLLQKQWYEHLPGPDGDRSNPQPRATSAVPPADELLVTLKGLPVFECHRGPAVGEAPGFASLLERRYLAPAGVQEEVLDGKFLVVDGEAERQTLTAVLGVQQLARVEYYRDHILPRIGQLAPPLRDTVMLDLLHQLSSLLDEDASFAAALRSMCFVPARSGQLQAPETLYDPRNPELVELLDPETSFPEGAFATDAVLGSLQLLGMRSAVDTATLLQSARYVDSLRVTDEQAAFDRAKMLLEYLKVEAGRLLGDARHISIVNGKGEAAHFWAALGQICWCPVICEPPAACLPWPAVSERLVPPRCARPSSDMWLVSGTLRVLDGECSEGPLAVGLGWTQKPPASVVAAQLKQVGAMHRGGADTATRQALAAAVPQIYTALAALDAHGMELCRAVLEGAACVWVGACFATVEQVAISGPLNLAPWLYVLPGELAPFRDLLLQLGVPHHFSPRQYVSVLHGMREAAADTPLTAAQLEQALSVVQALADMSPDASHLFAPDSRSVLAPVSDLVFNDAPWTSLQDVRFVHPKISHEVAERVGVGSLRRRMLAQSADFMQLGLHSAQAFGQSEALTTRLKHIIDAYADGPGIIMELIQNADDAGATEVALLLDDQTYACNSIISPQMAAWQGPALCVYNDAVFSPADFSAISRIGQDSKLDKPAATGRFGLGWNAVYHLTDVPSFVSGDYLVAFDPHARYLPGISPAQPGLKIAFQRANLLAQFPDSFSPYLQFGCTLHETFQGTLFRFPLRSEATASTSDIKAAPYSPRDVLALFEAFRGEAGKALLFLKSVTRVAVHVRRAGQARPKLLFRASLSTAEGGEAPQAAICRFVGGPGGKVQKDAFYQRLKATLPASLPSSCSLVTVALQDSSGRSDEERWLVCNAMGGGRARELAIRQPKDSRGLLPWVGVAGRLNPTTTDAAAEAVDSHPGTEASTTGGLDDAHEADATELSTTDGRATNAGAAVDVTALANSDLTPAGSARPAGAAVTEGAAGAAAASHQQPGQAFCFLPLPVRTGLPVHVNGYFELSSNRRDIWYGSDMAGGGKARSDWNVALLEDALAPALANMLVKVAQVLGPTPAYYRLWPTGHVAEPWAFLVQRLYGQASSLPVAWTDACGGRWLPVQDAFFPDAACRQSAPLTAALVTLGVNLVSRALPEPVARNFLAMTPGAQEVTPAAVRRHLLQHKQQLGRQQGSQAAQAAGLLQYCLSGIDCEDAGSVVQLARLPLAVMASAELRTFTAGTSEPMYVVAKEDLQLLHRNADCLIAWDTSTPLGSSLARVAKTGALNLRLLTAEALAATFLPRILPARWRGISTVQWTADDGQQPTVKTMQALWTRLAAFEDLSPLQQWPLLPVKGGRLCRLSRAAQVVQEGSWAEAVGTALAKLGCHVLDAGMLPDRVQHTQLLKYVHPSSGAGILAAIGAAAESDDVGAHAMQLAERADLTAAERQQLRTLLLQGRWFGSSEASCIQSAQLAVLKALPIFESAYRPGGDNGDDIQPFALAEHNHAASESDEEADSASTDSSSDSDAANSPGAAPPEPPAASLPDLSPTPPTVPPPTRMRKPQQRAALFVDLQGPRYLAPEGVHPGVLTAEFLRPGSASEAQLLVGHLGVQQLSAVDFLLQHVFPRVGSLPASPRDDLMLDLVRDLHAAEPAVVAALKQVAFVPTSGGKLLAPQQLYDPAIPALRALLDADACFPAEAFASDVQVLAGLRMLGLRSSIGAEALLQAARSLEGRSLADGQAEERGRALLAHLDALAGEAEDAATCAIWAPLSTIAWCPVLSEAPHPGMPWPSTANVRDNSPPDRSKAQHSTGFAAPSTVRPASDAWLVSATLRILDGTCSAALAERLGWAKPLPSAALVAQLVELGKRHEVVDDAELQETLASTAAELYRQLADRITGTDAEIILPALRHSACVWVDRGFAPASITALSSPVDYRPYLFTVPETLTPFRDMLLTIGVPEEFRAAHCVHGLRRIHEAHEGVALTPDQLLMACLLAKNLAILKEQGSAPPGVIHLPDQAGVMEAAAHLYFNDADWLMEESNRLVHPDVDQLTAEGLGVQSLRYHHQVDTQMTQNMRAKPAAELKAALEQQPAGMLSALWDLLEVADAAGADAIDIVMDMRTHPSQSLLQPALAAFQGPALCVSIRGVALSVAELFALQCPPVPYILRNRRCSFGSGLLNSYQFCDLPSMVSGEYLLLFDSLGSHVGASSTSSRAEPMVKQYRHLNSDLPARFGDQFAVWDFAGVDIAQQRGTLARFPLRTAQQANTSSIHKVAWTPAQMQQAVEEFAGGVGGVLLFLRGLRSVRLISWPAEGTPPHVLHEVTASPHLPDARVPFDEREWRRTTFSLASILNSKAYAGVRKALSFTVNSRTGNGDIQRDSWLVSAVSGAGRSRDLALKHAQLDWTPTAAVAVKVPAGSSSSESTASPAAAPGTSILFTPFPMAATNEPARLQAGAAATAAEAEAGSTATQQPSEAGGSASAAPTRQSSGAGRGTESAAGGQTDHDQDSGHGRARHTPHDELAGAAASMPAAAATSSQQAAAGSPGVDSSSPSKASSTAAAATAVHRHPTAPFLLFGNFVVDRSQGRRIYGLSSEAWSEERVDQAGEAASPPATPAAAHMQRLQLQMREREREAAALNAQFNQELLFSCGTAAWLDAFELLRDRLVAAHRPCAPLYELIPDMPQGGEQSLMTAFHQQICRELAKRQCWQLRNGRMVYLRDGCFLQAAVDDLGTAALDFIQREFPLFKVPWRVKVALEAAGVAGTRDITPAVVRAMLKQYVGRAEVRGGRLHLRPAEAAELLHFCCGDLWAVGELPQEDRTGHPPDSAGTAVGSLSAEMVASINQVLPRGVDVDTLISSMRDALGLVEEGNPNSNAGSSRSIAQQGNSARTLASAAAAAAAQATAGDPAQGAAPAGAAGSVDASSDATSAVPVPQGHYIEALVRDCVGLPVPVASGMIAALGHKKLLFWSANCTVEPPSLMDSFADSFLHPQVVRLLRDTFSDPLVSRLLKVQCYGLADVAEHLRLMLPTEWRTAGGQAGFLVPWRYGQAGGPRPQWLQRVWDLLVQIHADGPSLGDAAPSPEVAAAVPADQHWAALDAFALLPCTNGSVIRVSKRAMVFTPPEPAPAPAPTGAMDVTGGRAADSMQLPQAAETADGNDGGSDRDPLLGVAASPHVRPFSQPASSSSRVGPSGRYQALSSHALAGSMDSMGSAGSSGDLLPRQAAYTSVPALPQAAQAVLPALEQGFVDRWPGAGQPTSSTDSAASAATSSAPAHALSNESRGNQVSESGEAEPAHSGNEALWSWLLPLLERLKCPILDSNFRQCMPVCNPAPLPEADMLLRKLRLCHVNGVFDVGALEDSERARLFALWAAAVPAADVPADLDMLRALPVYPTCDGQRVALPADHTLTTCPGPVLTAVAGMHRELPDTVKASMLVYDAAFLALYAKVGIPVLKEPDLLLRVLLPNHSILSAALQNASLQYIARNWGALENNAPLVGGLAAAAFIPSGTGELRRPSQLYDPSNKLLARVFRGQDVFPTGMFAHASWLKVLRKSGLHSSIDRDVFLACARRVEARYAALPSMPSMQDAAETASIRREVLDTAAELAAFFKANVASMHSVQFAAAVREIVFVPALKGLPGHPDSQRVLIKFSAAALRKDWALVWTVRGTLEEAHAPPQMFGNLLLLRSPPLLDTVCKHLHKVGQNHGEEVLSSWPSQAGTPKAACKAILVHLAAQGLSDEQCGRLREAAFVPVANCTRLVAPAGLFARLRDDLAPFAYQVPTALASHMEILKKLGARDMPTAGDLLSILQGVRGHFGPSALNINDCRAVMRLLQYITSHQAASLAVPIQRALQHGHISVPARTCHLVNAVTCVHAASAPSRLLDRVDPSKVTFVHPQLPLAVCTFLGIPALEGVVEEVLDAAFQPQYVEEIQGLSCGAVRQLLGSGQFARAVHAVVLEYARDLPSLKAITLKTIMQQLHIAAEGLRFVQSCATRIVLRSSRADVTRSDASMRVDEYMYTPPGGKPLLFVAEPPPDIPVKFVLARAIKRCLGNRVPISVRDLLDCTEASLPHLQRLLVAGPGVAEDEALSAHGQLGSAVLGTDLALMTIKPLRSYITGDLVGYRGALDPQAAAAAAARARAQDGSGGAGGIQAPLLYGRVTADARPPPGAPAYRVNVETAPGQFRDILSSQLYCFRSQPQPAGEGADASSTEGSPRSAAAPASSSTATRPPGTASTPSLLDASQEPLLSQSLDADLAGPSGPKGPSSAADVSLEDRMAALREMLSAAELPLDLDRAKLIEELQALRDERAALSRDLGNTQQELHQLKEEAETEAGQSQCRVCLTRKMDAVIIPCGHALCGECAGALRNGKCPMCRATGTVHRLFL